MLSYAHCISIADAGSCSALTCEVEARHAPRGARSHWLGDISPLPFSMAPSYSPTTHSSIFRYGFFFCMPLALLVVGIASSSSADSTSFYSNGLVLEEDQAPVPFPASPSHPSGTPWDHSRSPCAEGFSECLKRTALGSRLECVDVNILTPVIFEPSMVSTRLQSLALRGRRRTN